MSIYIILEYGDYCKENNIEMTFKGLHDYKMNFWIDKK